MSAAEGLVRPATLPLVCPGLMRRLAAMAYELLLLSGVLAVTLILPHILIATLTHRVATATVLWANLFLVVLVYFVGFWSRGGQTLAMKTWRIRLVTRDGHAIRPAGSRWHRGASASSGRWSTTTDSFCMTGWPARGWSGPKLAASRASVALSDAQPTRSFRPRPS